MQVHDDLKAMVACPADSLLQVWKLTGDVWLSGANLESPVADGQPDVVEAKYRRGVCVNVRGCVDWVRLGLGLGRDYIAPT